MGILIKNINIGSSDISSIGDGTLTGAIQQIHNSNEDNIKFAIVNDSYGYYNSNNDFTSFKNPIGNATTADVLIGKVFSSAAGDNLTGALDVSNIHVGTAAPTSSLGQNGEIYIQYMDNSDPVETYQILSKHPVEENTTLASSVAQLLNTSFYILARSRDFTKTFYYYYTNEIITNANVNFIKRTAGNDVFNATLYHSLQVDDTDTFYIYWTDEDQVNHYIQMSASSNLAFTTDISAATIFGVESITNTYDFLIRGMNVNSSTNYYLNSKAGDNGVGFQGSTYTDSSMSFLLASSINVSQIDPYDLDGEQIAIVMSSTLLKCASNTMAATNRLATENMTIYSDLQNSVLSGKLTLWTCQSTQTDGDYYLKNSKGYLRVVRNGISLVTTKSTATPFTFIFAFDSNTFKGKCRLTTKANNGFFTALKYNSGNYFTGAAASNNSAKATEEWMYICSHSESSNYIKKVYVKKEGAWVEKKDSATLFTLTKIMKPDT